MFISSNAISDYSVKPTEELLKEHPDLISKLAAAEAVLRSRGCEVNFYLTAEANGQSPESHGKLRYMKEGPKRSNSSPSIDVSIAEVQSILNTCKLIISVPCDKISGIDKASIKELQERLDAIDTRKPYLLWDTTLQLLSTEVTNIFNVLLKNMEDIIITEEEMPSKPTIIPEVLKLLPDELAAKYTVSYEKQMESVQREGTDIKYISNQTPEICLAAVQENGDALRYVRNQTPEVCLAAVKQHWMALMYVRNQTPEICLAAVQWDGIGLKYVHSQTPEVCLAAVQQNGDALQYVHQQTTEICLAAVKQSAWALKYVHNQSLEICLEAVRQKGEAVMYYVDFSIMTPEQASAILAAAV